MRVTPLPSDACRGGCGEGLVVRISDPAEVVSPHDIVEGSRDVGFGIIDRRGGLLHTRRGDRRHGWPAPGPEPPAQSIQRHLTGQVSPGHRGDLARDNQIPARVSSLRQARNDVLHRATGRGIGQRPDSTSRDEPAAVAMALTVVVGAAAVPGGGSADRFPDTELGKDRMDRVASPAVCRYPGFDGMLGGEADVPDDVAAISQRAESKQRQRTRLRSTRWSGRNTWPRSRRRISRKPPRRWRSSRPRPAPPMVLRPAIRLRPGRRPRECRHRLRRCRGMPPRAQRINPGTPRPRQGL